MSTIRDKRKRWSLEHILDVPGIQALINPALPREERYQNESRWVRNGLACFEVGEAFTGMLEIVQADEHEMFCLSGERVRVEDEPTYVIMNNPSFRDLRFNCGRFKDDDSNQEGCVMVVDLRTDIEIRRIDCRTPNGRRELFEFLIDWARVNPEIRTMGTIVSHYDDWSLENIFNISSVQALIDPAIKSEFEIDSSWTNESFASFEMGDALGGMQDLVESRERSMFCLRGAGVRSEDAPMYVVMKNPSFQTLRFNCGRWDDPDDTRGRMIVVNKTSTVEIKRIDCRTAHGRRQLFEFLIDWARANPAPLMMPNPKKRTAAGIVAERALKSRGRKLGRRNHGTLGRSGLSAVTEDEDEEGVDDST